MDSRHIQALFKADTVFESSNRCIDNLKQHLYEYIRNSCILWWSGYKPVKTAAGSIFPDYLERAALQLYPLERDRIDAACPPPARRAFKALDIRAFYNAPLYRLSWRLDDYDFSYLDKAVFLHNSEPFCLFQGVCDTRLDSALILVGNGWNRGVSGIPAKSCVKSLSFLHSYIINKTEMQVVGYYIVHFSDGSSEKLEIEYGRDIVGWKGDTSGSPVAYGANPAISGVTFYGTPFAIHSYKWVNPKPDIPIDRIDALAADDCEDGGIALFGVTCTI
jgi:hypothetical protein